MTEEIADEAKVEAVAEAAPVAAAADAPRIAPNHTGALPEEEVERITRDLIGVLKTVYDPEIPVDIVNLGLVYDCVLEEANGKRTALVKMTLTAPGCGMGPVIAADAQAKIMTIDGIDDARVELVWDPAWNQEMISEEGKMKLGMI